MAPKGRGCAEEQTVDAHLASLQPIPQGPLSQCSQDLGWRKYVRGHGGVRLWGSRIAVPITCGPGPRPQPHTS